MTQYLSRQNLVMLAFFTLSMLYKFWRSRKNTNVTKVRLTRDGDMYTN